MLNDFNIDNSVNIKIPCVGTLQKSHPKSFFIRCHAKSDYFAAHVASNPRVLQIMIFGDNEVMVEILPQSVYDEWVKELDNKKL